MTPIGIQGLERSFLDFLGGGLTAGGGPCARDLQEGRDITSPGFGYGISSTTPACVVESYLTNSLGQMLVLHPDRSLPLRFAMDYLPPGYDFSI